MTAPFSTPGTRRVLLTVIFLVARREILMRLRSRVLLLGTFAMVALVVAGVVGASLLGGSSGPARAMNVGFTGGSQTLGKAFSALATALGQPVIVSVVADDAAGESQVAAGTLDVLVTGPATSPTAVVNKTPPPLVVAALERAVLAARLSAAGLPPAAVISAVAGTQVPVRSLQPAAPARTANQIAGLGVAILLMVTLALYGILVAQGVIEEKATRIIEILLATIPPSGLLAGKIVGIGLIGLLQVTIVATAALIAVAVTHLATIPALGGAEVLGYLMWFLLGFLLYATAYAAVASLVSRPEEVQAAVTPISVFLGVSYLLVILVALPNPSSPIVTLLSLLPPFAPILMSVRMAGGDVALWQVGLALALMLVSIPALIWFAGRIYANSVLRTGARVPIAEAWRGR